MLGNSNKFAPCLVSTNAVLHSRSISHRTCFIRVIVKEWWPHRSLRPLACSLVRLLTCLSLPSSGYPYPDVHDILHGYTALSLPIRVHRWTHVARADIRVCSLDNTNLRAASGWMLENALFVTRMENCVIEAASVVCLPLCYVIIIVIFDNIRNMWHA